MFNLKLGLETAVRILWPPTDTKMINAVFAMNSGVHLLADPPFCNVLPR